MYGDLLQGTWIILNLKFLTCFKKQRNSISCLHIVFIRSIFHALSPSKEECLPEVRGGADKSLARPTSRCCGTESIVSVKRGVSSCAELQVFSCYRG